MPKPTKHAHILPVPAKGLGTASTAALIARALLITRKSHASVGTQDVRRQIWSSEAFVQ
jgi:hypothetical protein